MADLFEDSDLENEVYETKENDVEKYDKKHIIEDQLELFYNEKHQDSDEDVKLFVQDIEQEDEQLIDPIYDKLIKGIVSEAKKKFKDQVELEARRNRRQERILQYYFSRAYIIIQIGRCLKITEQDFGF